MTSSVTMAGLAPVGVKQQRARRVAAAAPARAHLGSAFTAGGGKSLEGQRLSVAVAPAAGARRGSRCVTSMAAKIAGYIKLAIEAGVDIIPAYSYGLNDMYWTLDWQRFARATFSRTRQL